MAMKPYHHQGSDRLVSYVERPMTRLVLTRGVNDRVADDSAFAKFVTESLGRHARHDWGEMDAEDKARNDAALVDGSRLFSAYIKPDLPKIWIITEARDDQGKRLATTVLLPNEY